MPQVNTNDVCKMEDGRLIFTIDLRWNDEQRKQIADLFDLDSLIFTAVANGKPMVVIDNINWQIVKKEPFVYEISKALNSTPVSQMKQNDILMVEDKMIKIASAVERESAIYGVNNFILTSTFYYSDGVAQFYLPEYNDANHVFLSGSFNNWSTMQLPMQKTDSGWIVTLPLQTGKYAYKYIVDGRWIADPNNRLKEEDNNGGKNSVVFCYNYRFVLKGFRDAEKVIIAGSFNNWDRKALKMLRTADGWELPIYLHDGTHAYKFIVDNNWITDPGNKLIRPDGRGNENSFIGIGDTLCFRLKGFAEAKRVNVAGNFNGWNPGELFLEKSVTGEWQLPYALAPGNYEYKFVIDWKWMPDPDNPYTSGGGETQNSILVVKPNHTFVLNNYQDAKKVIVTGSFNWWNQEGYRMVKKDGKWIFPIFLRPGKYTYKFIIDGTWIVDPDNKIWENNEYGTNNSVLWIEP